jgi:hypothetical protein
MNINSKIITPVKKYHFIKKHFHNKNLTAGYMQLNPTLFNDLSTEFIKIEPITDIFYSFCKFNFGFFDHKKFGFRFWLITYENQDFFLGANGINIIKNKDNPQTNLELSNKLMDVSIIIFKLFLLFLNNNHNEIYVNWQSSLINNLKITNKIMNF